MSGKVLAKAPGFRVLVKLKPIEKAKEVFSAGGLILEHKTDLQLQREQEATCKAYVVDIGESAWWDVAGGKPWCKVGDCVLISKYSGVFLNAAVHGVTQHDSADVYRMINDQDIQAIFPDEGLNND